jgi:hypothetical protein
MAAEICPNNALVAITSTIRNVVDLRCRTILPAPTLTSRAGSVVNDRCLTASGDARVGGEFTGAYSIACGCGRAALASKRRRDNRVRLVASLPSLIHRTAVPRRLWNAATRSAERGMPVTMNPTGG